MLAAVFAFGGAVLLGATMLAWIVRKGTNPPLPLVVFHGLFAATGFVLLIVAIPSAPTPGAPIAALAILTVAALAGAYLLLLTLKGKTLSIQHVVMHGAFALLAYGTLIALTVWKG
jgi:hypothetical protein